VTPAQQAALDEIEHAAQSLVHDLWLMASSLDVILAEVREAKGGEPVAPRLVIVTRGGRR
jgi:hypothetical protein